MASLAPTPKKAQKATHTSSFVTARPGFFTLRLPRDSRDAPCPATETTRTTCVMTRKKDRACDTRAASGPSPGRPRGKTAKAKRTGEPKLGVFEKAPFRVYPKKPLLSPSVTDTPPKKELHDSMTPWECAACGHAHKLTRRSMHLLAQCARCACVRGDVVHALFLLAERVSTNARTSTHLLFTAFGSS